MKKTALVCGAGGFIGNHMVNRLKEEGYWVRAIDIKEPEYSKSNADHFVLRDLRNQRDVHEIIGYAGVCRNPYQIFATQFDKPFDEIYQFAADMGGAGYIFTGEHDADVMHNSATINLNVLDAVKSFNQYNKVNQTKIFYSSSACIYPEENQVDSNNPNCEESSAYPANPDSEYGWEKLFSERLYASYNRNYGIPVRVARYHNIYGPLGTWQGGKEKAPAAICRKVIGSEKEIEIWGDGQQTRSFLYIDDCIDATRLLMQSEFMGPVNIGSEEMVTINGLTDLACSFEDKQLIKKHISGPQGVRGRNSDNRLIEEKLRWKPKYALEDGLKKTYFWIKSQME
jgi:nucleoside-diphosphate-sugar epimerase